MKLYKITYIESYCYNGAPNTETIVGTFKEKGNLIEITTKKYWDSYHKEIERGRKNIFGKCIKGVYEYGWSDVIKSRPFLIPISHIVKIEEFKK